MLFVDLFSDQLFIQSDEVTLVLFGYRYPFLRDEVRTGGI